jgi:hypothetical protein
LGLVFDLSSVDRRRLNAAIALTAIALPVLFIASAGSSDADEGSIAATTTTVEIPSIAGDRDIDAPANLEGPVVADPVGEGQLAFPADNSGRMLRGKATFKRFPDGAEGACATTLVPLGAEITVRNLDNGRKTVCSNINIGPTSATFDIVLHTGVFEKIAQLVDAPLPVELTW